MSKPTRCPCGSASVHAACLNEEFDRVRKQVPLGVEALRTLLRNEQTFLNAGFSDPNPIPAGADPLWQPCTYQNFKDQLENSDCGGDIARLRMQVCKLPPGTFLS